MLLTELYGTLIDFFTEGDGLSRSAATAEKNSMANELALLRLRLGTAPVSLQKISIHMPGTEPVEKEDSSKTADVLPIKEISVLIERQAFLMERMALLGHRINLLSRIRDDIAALSPEELSIKFGKKVVEKPVKATRTEVDIEADRFEDLVQYATRMRISVDPVFINRGLALESRCAAIGMSLTLNSLVLLKGITFMQSSSPRISGERAGIVIVKDIPAYDKDELRAVEKELRGNYDSYQSELNGLKKLLRDQLREAVLKEESALAAFEMGELAAYTMWLNWVNEQRLLLEKELASLKIIKNW